MRLRERMPNVLENADENLTPRMRNLLSWLWEEWKDLEQQLTVLNLEVEQIASSDAACRRLRQIPGIGPLIATAIVAAIGNGAAFHKDASSPRGLAWCRGSTRLEGRQNYLGLVSVATSTCVRP
jgi:transposase